MYRKGSNRLSARLKFSIRFEFEGFKFLRRFLFEDFEFLYRFLFGNTKFFNHFPKDFICRRREDEIRRGLVLHKFEGSRKYLRRRPGTSLKRKSKKRSSHEEKKERKRKQREILLPQQQKSSENTRHKVCKVCLGIQEVDGRRRTNRIRRSRWQSVKTDKSLGTREVW